MKVLELQEINGLIVWKKSSLQYQDNLRAVPYSAGVGRIFVI